MSDATMRPAETEIGRATQPWLGRLALAAAVTLAFAAALALWAWRADAVFLDRLMSGLAGCF